MTISGLPSQNTCGVYSLRHSSGQEYVGGSIKIRTRVLCHLKILRKGNHPSTKLQKLWDESSLGDWSVLVLEECDSEHLIQVEQKFMDLSVGLLNYMTVADRNWLGRKWPPDFGEKSGRRIRQLIAEGRSGRSIWSEEANQRHAELMRQYVREGRVGSKNWSAETRAKAGRTQKELNSTPEKRASQSEKAKKLHAEGRLGARTWKPGEREKRAERMRQLHAEGRVGPKSHKRYKEKHLPAVSLSDQTGPSDPTPGALDTHAQVPPRPRQ